MLRLTVSFLSFLVHDELTFVLKEFERHKLETAASLAGIEARMVGMMQGVEETRQTLRRVESLENQVGRIAVPLERILNAIQIDDNLRFVPESRRIADDPAVSQATARDFSIPSDLHVEVPIEMPIEVPIEVAMDEDEDSASAVPPSSITGTVTTPSDRQEDIRMELEVQREIAVDPLPNPDPAPVGHPTAPPPTTAESGIDVTMPEHPTPPTFNLITPTPQASQEQAPPAVSVVASAADLPPPPLATPLPPPARTPPPPAGLQPPAARGRGRS